MSVLWHFQTAGLRFLFHAWNQSFQTLVWFHSLCLPKHSFDWHSLDWFLVCGWLESWSMMKWGTLLQMINIAAWNLGLGITTAAYFISQAALMNSQQHWAGRREVENLTDQWIAKVKGSEMEEHHRESLWMELNNKKENWGKDLCENWMDFWAYGNLVKTAGYSFKSQ